MSATVRQSEEDIYDVHSNQCKEEAVSIQEVENLGRALGEIPYSPSRHTNGHRNAFFPETNCQSKSNEVNHSQLDAVERYIRPRLKPEFTNM